MSGRLVGEVLNHAPTDLRPLDFMVLIALAEAAHDKDRTARHDSSAESLAYRVRPPSTPSSIRNSLQRLKERGLIRPVIARPSRGQQQNWIITKLSEHHRDGTPLASPDVVTLRPAVSVTARSDANYHPQPVENRS